MPTDNYTGEAIDRILDKLQDETLAVALSGKESNGYMYLVGEARTALQELIRGEVVKELEAFNTNGAVIHDCGRRVDGIVQTKRIADRIATLSSGQTGKES